MYRVKTNKEIGAHLTLLIAGSSIPSDRQFAIEYLKKRDGANYNPDDIQKMQNRICQIKQGNKGVQIEDLPIFAEILEVSVDDILSAGTFSSPAVERTSNFSIARTTDPDEWKRYLAREDTPILNPDEFNKTAIDYALETGNYAFLKYLVDQGYIWFVGEDKRKYTSGFDAGTSIKGKDIGMLDTLNSRLVSNDDLRFRMISLAIRHKDFAMLEEFHAREIPKLYTIGHLLANNPREDELPASDNIKFMIDDIATAPKEVVKYFLEGYEIESALFSKRNWFIFPYAGELLARMIRKKRKGADYFLRMALDWNKSRLDLINQMISDSSLAYREHMQKLDYQKAFRDDDYQRIVMEEYYFYAKSGFVAYTKPYLIAPNVEGLISNVVRVNAASKKLEEQRLIDELNASYDRFVQLLMEKGK